MLDLEACRSDVPLFLVNCHFVLDPVFRDARLQSVNLQGSDLPALNMHRLRTEEDVFLRAGFHASGAVDFTGSRIGQDLDCTEGSFRAGVEPE